jgi:hypothetical protein
MPQRFDRGGIHFQYPDNWRLEREETESGWTVSVQSPDTAFFLLSVSNDGPTTEEVVDTALEALRSEYPNLEAEECVDTLAGQMTVGHDIRFFSFDLTNTCRTRSFYCGEGTVLVMWQANDLELDFNEPVLRAICASLEVDED